MTPKAVIGDSLQSAEFWALAPVLTLIAEGGLTDVQCCAVAAIYVAFVAGRVLLKWKGVAEIASKVAPLLLAGLVLVTLPSCKWLDQPIGPMPSEPTAPVVVEGVGTVTLEPEPPPVTNGDAVAASAGEIVGAATGVGLFGLLVAKGLGALIGSRRKKVQA